MRKKKKGTTLNRQIEKNNYHLFLEKEYLLLVPYEIIQKERKIYLTIVAFISTIIAFFTKDFIPILIIEVLITLIFILLITVLDFSPKIINDERSYKNIESEIVGLLEEIGYVYNKMENYFKWYIGFQIFLFLILFGIYVGVKIYIIL